MQHIPTTRPAAKSAARDLCSFARELGVTGLGARGASSLEAQYGTSGARRVIRQASEIIRASSDTIAPITSWQVARQLLASCGGNFDEALHRATHMAWDGAKARRYTRADSAVADAALGHGFDVPLLVIKRWVKTYGPEGAIAFADQVAEIVSASAEVANPYTYQGAVYQIARFGGGDAVLERLRDIKRKRTARWSRSCTVTVLPRERAQADNKLAACGCGRCEERLLARFIGMQHTIATKFDVPVDEALIAARFSLSTAIERWAESDQSIGADFGRFYGGVIRNSLYQLADRERKRASTSDSLDALFQNDDGTTLTVADRVHDERTVDPARIVIWREQLAEAIAAWRDRRADRAAEYDRELVPA